MRRRTCGQGVVAVDRRYTPIMLVTGHTSNNRIFFYISLRNWTSLFLGIAKQRSIATQIVGGSPDWRADPTENCTTTGVKCIERIAGKLFFTHLLQTINIDVHFNHYYYWYNSRRHIYEIPVPFCLNRLYKMNCPLECPEEVPRDPVCGSDGNIYQSECEMKKLTCG